MRKQSVAGLLFSSKAGKGGYSGDSSEMYALDTISFPGFCGSYEKIQGWFQSHSIFTNLWPEIRDCNSLKVSTFSITSCIFW